jgi:hypothetical protein
MMEESAMAKNLIAEMKAKIAASGTSKKEILYFGKDSVKRVRFLQELDTGYVFEFHNDWAANILELCKDPEDHENCPLCEQGIKIYENFAWSVWDYDSNSVRILLFKANGISPIPSFIEMYEEFGTIMDRDYKIKKVGQGQGGSFVVTPLDKERFNNKKAKPFTKKQMQEILDKAYAKQEVEEDDDEEEDEEEVTSKKSKKQAKKKKQKKSLRSRFEELSFKELKEIGLEIGLSKKELRAFEDEEELIDEFFDNYEEEDLQELLEDLEAEKDEEEDEDDED